jgi:hypothetical protein
MMHFPKEVLEDLRYGASVIKQSSATFNQVDPDQSQEWINATGKRSGAIVGIAKTPTVLDGWNKINVQGNA